MTRFAIIRGVALMGIAALSLAACSQQQLASPAGQIFCHIQTQGGGSLVVGLVDASATAASGSAAPIVTPAVGLSTAAVQNYLNTQCAVAATQVPGAIGSAGAVPAPAMPVQTVAVAPVPLPTTPPSTTTP